MVRCMKDGAAVMIGGAAGTLARAGLAEALPITPGHVPWATFAVNIGGTLLLGWLVAAVAGGLWRPLIGTGFCGALTTFSTFQVETIRLARNGHGPLAVSYAAASMAVGMAVAVGATVAARRRRYG
jgi:CrcB protein